MEQDADLYSTMLPFLDGVRVEQLLDSFVPKVGILAALDDADLEHGVDGSAVAGVQDSRTVDILLDINRSLVDWEAQDAEQFHRYLGSVARSLHLQEALIEILGALLDEYATFVAAMRHDVVAILDRAIEALDEVGSFNVKRAAAPLVVVGAGLGLAAAFTSPAAGGALVTAALSSGILFDVVGSVLASEGGSDVDQTIGGTPQRIRSDVDRLLELVSCRTKEETENLCRALGVVLRCISSPDRELQRRVGIDLGHLVPITPAVFENPDPARFRLPVYIEPTRREG